MSGPAPELRLPRVGFGFWSMIALAVLSLVPGWLPIPCCCMPGSYASWLALDDAGNRREVIPDPDRNGRWLIIESGLMALDDSWVMVFVRDDWLGATPIVGVSDRYHPSCLELGPDGVTVGSSSGVPEPARVFLSNDVIERLRWLGPWLFSPGGNPSPSWLGILGMDTLFFLCLAALFWLDVRKDRLRVQAAADQPQDWSHSSAGGIRRTRRIGGSPCG